MNEMANAISRNLSNQFIAGKHALQWVWQWTFLKLLMDRKSLKLTSKTWLQMFTTGTMYIITLKQSKLTDG